MPLALHIANLH